MTREVISVAVALAAAYVLGWCGRGEREKRLAQQPRTLDMVQIERSEPGTSSLTWKRSGVFTDKEFARFMAAVRGGEER